VTSDADGNTLTDTSGRVNTWDSQNRLVSCTQNGTTSTYTYGADGLRRSTTVNGVTTYYAYDGQTLIREMKRNAQTGVMFNTVTYLQGPQGGECRVDETQVNENYTNPLTYAQGVRGQTSWYIYDGLGSVQGELRITGPGSGGATSTYAFTPSPKYDVYGLTRSNPGSASSRQGFVGSLGHVSDTETGLIYMRARYYDPSIGRFESEDPDCQSSNWFAYCGNNPINLVDASGREFGPLEGLEFLDQLHDLISMYSDYKETINSCNALNKLLNKIHDAEDSGDVEEAWGNFMEVWSEGTGEEKTEEKISEYTYGDGGPMDVGFSGSMIGLKLITLCVGYDAREQWYSDQCDE